MNADDDDAAAEEEEVTGTPVPRLIVSLYANLVTACSRALTQMNATVNANHLPSECLQILAACSCCSLAH